MLLNYRIQEAYKVMSQLTCWSSGQYPYSDSQLYLVEFAEGIQWESLCRELLDLSWYVLILEVEYGNVCVNNK